MNHTVADETSELNGGLKNVTSHDAEARGSKSGQRVHPQASLIPRHYLFPDRLISDETNCIGVAKTLPSRNGPEAKRLSTLFPPPPVADKFLPEGVASLDFAPAADEVEENEPGGSGGQSAFDGMIEEGGAIEEGEAQDAGSNPDGASPASLTTGETGVFGGLLSKTGNPASQVSSGTRKRVYTLAALGALLATAAIPVVFLHWSTSEEAGGLQTRLEHITGQVAGNASTFLGQMFKHDDSAAGGGDIQRIALSKLSVSSQEVSDEGVNASASAGADGVAQEASLPVGQPLSEVVEAEAAEVQDAPESVSVAALAAKSLQAEESASSPESVLEALEAENALPPELAAHAQVLKANVPWDEARPLTGTGKKSVATHHARAASKSAPKPMASAKSAPKHHRSKPNAKVKAAAKAAPKKSIGSEVGVATTQPEKVATLAAAPAAPVTTNWAAERQKEMTALIQSGKTARAQGKLLYASMQFEEALKMAVKLKDETKQRWLRSHLGQCYLLLGEARMRKMSSIEDCRAARDLFMKAFAQGFTGERNQNNILLMDACLEDSSS